MPTKAEMYAQMANSVATRLTGSWQDWAAFLTTAARLYKYPYQEQLMIYAQRPEATACAEYDLWNDKMGRYVKRGSQGIALLDDSGDRPRLRYVFDISDTGTRPNSRNLTLWSMEPEHHEMVSAMLENRYGIADQSLPQQIANIAGVLANRYWNDNRDDILRIVDGSFLEEYDELNIAMQFRSAAAISITYAIMSRCGLEPEQYFGYEDFMSIFDFNTPETIASLGTAVSQSCQEVLRQIGITIQNAEREKIAERSQNHEQQPDIHEERGLSDSRPEAEQPAGNAAGQVREDAQELPEGAPSRDIQPDASLGEAVPAPAGDRADGPEPPLADDSGTGEGSGSDGAAEGVRPDEMDRPDEQLQGAGGGDHPERTDFQLSLFPSEDEQINSIDEAESVKAPSAFSVSQADIDNALRNGSGFEDGKLRIYAMYQRGTDEKEAAAFIRNEYGTGGRSFDFLNGTHGFVDYRPSSGIIFNPYGDGGKVTLKWPAVEKRLREIIREGSYLTEDEKAQYQELESSYAGLGSIPMPQPQTAFPQPQAHAMPEKVESSPDEAITQSDIEAAIQRWNGDDDSRQRVQAYMAEHARDKQTAAWLAGEYGAPGTKALLVTRTGTDQAAEIPWAKVQRLLAGMVKDGIFYSEPQAEIPQEHSEAAEGAITEPAEARFPYSVGDTVYLENGKPFIVTEVRDSSIQLRDPTMIYPIFRAESMESFARLMERYPQPEKAAPEEQKPVQPEMTSETVAVYPAEQNQLPYDIVVERLHTEPEHTPPEPQNFHITDDNLGAGGPKAKYAMNVAAIRTLLAVEKENRQATPEEQAVLSRYVGWGGVQDAFDESKPAWAAEYKELQSLLTPEEYASARASTLNAHFTSPTVIKAIYEAVGNMGFKAGNILEPAMGVGNFFGLLPDEMQNSRLYGVELDSITGRIAKQLYPKADITVAGFETTDRRDFYDLAVGNVPFGSYKVPDKAYDRLGFSIHDYFFAKTLDQVRPGGVVAFVTSRYTMDKQSPEVRKYIAQRADLLGAIRLPNNAFRANAGTDVVSDILFLQKRDRPIDIEPDWVHLGQNEDGFGINSYFIDHPEMILGRQTSESTQYGKQDFTVEPIEGLNFADQLHDALQNIGGRYTEAELPELGEDEPIDTSIPADPNVKNYSYTVVDGSVYYRENSRMVRPDLNATAAERVKGMVELRDCVQNLINLQLWESDPLAIRGEQQRLNRLYDSFTGKYGLINSRANSLAFADDSSYYLLCSLEVLDEQGELARKADMFTRRTIKQNSVITSVDTAMEALALSISEKAGVDMKYMSSLTGKDEETLASELKGVIFRDPGDTAPENIPLAFYDAGRLPFVTVDEYLSGNVRQKLALAEFLHDRLPAGQAEQFDTNVEALRNAQPKDLDASEIEVRLGATWISKEYIQQFMEELLEPPFYLRRSIQVNFSEFTAEWNITGKSSVGYNNINAYVTYGTERANAYRIFEDSLNLRDIRIYDTVTDPDGKERRVLNSKETTLAQQKQQAIREAFQDWVWKDPQRRQDLVKRYNEIFNSTRPREYDGSHIRFSGMNPEITLREHQKNAVAHILYGGNTLLAHEVGAGKTFEMVAACMESKRLGLSHKALFAVPNHLTEQWASEFLRLYPSANILVATRKDFETRNRKKFCARIATGDYDAVIIGHSQFEKIPVSQERQERLLQDQIEEIEEGIEELKNSRAENFTIKQMEHTRKSLEAKLKKLQDSTRKDDVVTFEQLGVDRLYVDEAHNYKNCFLYTKMRNVAGLSTSDAQKSSDMLLKCRYIDEISQNKGVIFATGTPVSNSMTELYVMQRYLQHETIQHKGLAHFDSWASTFGETTTAIELAPEGTGYRARTRFAKFFNLPELMTLFKEVADIKTSDQLHLPTPAAVYHNVVAQPTEIQKQMVQELSERAAVVHSGTIDPTKDNMLKITSDGRKLGLDQRIINPNLPDNPDSKVNQCVDNIYHIWDQGQPEKLTQLVFCDLSTPKAHGQSDQIAAKAAEGGINGAEVKAVLDAVDKEAGPDEPAFSVYDDIREKLVARGIPREQIAFIHEANTEVRKKELFAKVRSGQVRVLMGSTFKMGAGMNVQDRLVALHDLDAPWRPGDLEQRSGRIIRQGNQNKEVHIYRYVTEGTFDSYLWQTLENKQKFISQIMTSKSPVRSCEDIDETALSFAEIKALCAGDPRIKEKMDLDIEVARLKLMKANHQSQQYRLEDSLLKTFPEQIEQYKGYIEGFEADMKTLAEHPHPEDGFAGMEVRGDKLIDKDNAGAAILEACKEVKSLESVPIGSYRGFAMSLSVENFGKDYTLTLKGRMSHRVTLGTDARGNLTRIDNALAAMPERLKTVQSNLENVYRQVETAKAEKGKPFPQEEELKTKSARLAELNAELNIDERTPVEQLADSEPAKSERMSVLDRLRTPGVPGNTAKPKSYEEVR